MPVTENFEKDQFFVRRAGKLMATPLFLILLVVESTDLVFAVDSIPAIFAVTRDPFIVYTSNVFAILGLRALYFLLAGLLERFVYLKIGLAALLVFAGVKILVGSVHKIPITASLAVIVGILALAIVASLVSTHPRRNELLAPSIRIAAGVGLGLAALLPFVFGVAVGGDDRWGVALALGVIVAGAAVALWAGVVGLQRGLSRAPSMAAVRIGSGVLLGMAAIGLLGGTAVLRDANALWVELDLAILAAATGAVALGYLGLRQLRAQPAVVRAWATAGAAALLVLALFFALD
jgi:hypothetical protein